MAKTTTTTLLVLSLFVMAILNGITIEAANRGFLPGGKLDHDDHNNHDLLYGPQHFGLWRLWPFGFLHPWLFGPWWWLKNDKTAAAGGYNYNPGNAKVDEGHGNALTVP